jgi:hypothetical protein
MYSVNEIVSLGTQIGTKIAFEKSEGLRIESLLERHQRRLRNTKELLKHYQILRYHAKKAIYSAKHKMPSAIEILDEIEGQESTLFIESIRESSARTYIITEHIKNMLDFYYFLSKKAHKSYSVKWTIIKHLYLNNDKKNIDEVAKNMSYSCRQVARYTDEAIVDLSGLIFGIDGIKLQKSMSKRCHRHDKDKNI